VLCVVLVGAALTALGALVGPADTAGDEDTFGWVIALGVGLSLALLGVGRLTASAGAAHGPRKGATAFRLLTGPFCPPRQLLAAHAAGGSLPVERVAATDLHGGDVVVVAAGEVIPATGEVIAGVGPSAGARVPCGSRVASGWVAVRVAAGPSQH
jgi:K+-transporting ATPase ATPase B chain